jgi:hypothetical protein
LSYGDFTCGLVAGTEMGRVGAVVVVDCAAPAGALIGFGDVPMLVVVAGIAAPPSISYPPA